jgi:tetratricopeptide (TPR) repeat protein
MKNLGRSITFLTAVCLISLVAAALFASSADRRGMEQFELYTREGERLFSAGDYTGALEQFTKAHAIDPWDEEVNRFIELSLSKLKEIDRLLYQGFRFLENSQADRAYELFMDIRERIGKGDDRLLSLVEEGLEKAQEQKREKYRERIEESGTEYLDPGRIERLAILEERIKKEEFERELEAMRGRARGLFEEGEYEPSKKEWELLLGLVPGDAEASLYLERIDAELEEQRRFLELAGSTFQQGLRHYRSEEYVESKKQFEKVIAMDYRAEEAKGYIERIEELLLEMKKEQEERAIRIANFREGAKKLFVSGKYERSRRLWESLLEIVPADEEASLYLSKIDFKIRENERLLALAESYFQSGVRLFRDERFNEAIDQFENAVAMDFKVSEAREYIAEIEKKIGERELEEQKRRTEQVAKLLREGIKYYNLNDYKRSLAVLNEGLKLDPENSQIREYIVRDIIALKREEELAVSSRSPFYELVENLNRLGSQAYSRGEYTVAVKHFEQILLIFPFNERARLNLTKALSKTDPSLVQDILASMYREAQQLLEGGSDREAHAKLKLILEVDPDFEEARTLLADLIREQEREKPVITERDREQARELYMYGLGLYRSEKLEEAAKICQQAIELDPEFVEARVFLARAETQLRNLEKMGSKEEKVSGSYTDDLRIEIKRHYLDGIHLFMDGLYAEAITEWEEVLKIDPEHESARVNIERAKQRLGFEAGRESI